MMDLDASIEIYGEFQAERARKIAGGTAQVKAEVLAQTA